MKSVTAGKVTSEKTAQWYGEAILGNYGTPPFALVRGEGCYVWDAENRRYLDFTTGIAVNTVGHSHPYWVEKVTEQLNKVVHVSNLYHIPEQGRLGKRLVERAGPGKVFFCNSGAEANEFLIKLARLHGRELSGGEEGKRYKVITALNSFHGRTFGGMSATPQAKVQNGFAPLLDGFLHAEFNNVESFAAKIDDSVAAILLETVQGEGGIFPAEKSFLQGIRKLCDQHNLLLLIDEVQCGIGRTGKFFAFEHAGIQPDAIGMAKGLGGGFPIGADWVAEKYAHLFTPGSHGTTYGGNPLGCAAANAVLDIIENEQLLEHVEKLSSSWYAALNELAEKHPEVISGVRGLGFHSAIALKEGQDPLVWTARFRDNGLLVVRGGVDAIRLMPPLNVSRQILDTALEIIDFVIGTSK